MAGSRSSTWVFEEKSVGHKHERDLKKKELDEAIPAKNRSSRGK
jgi:hypothetical protein